MATAAQKPNGKAPATDLGTQVETLRTELSDLTHKFADMSKAKGEEALAAAKEKADETLAQAQDTADTVRLHAMEVQDEVSGFIKEKPLTALGIAAGVGLLVGFLSTRK